MNIFLKSALSVLMVTMGAETVSAGPIVLTEQGKDWTNERRIGFYSQDQGARIMPLSWYSALKQPSGEPFMQPASISPNLKPRPASRKSSAPPFDDIWPPSKRA